MRYKNPAGRSYPKPSSKNVDMTWLRLVNQPSGTKMMTGIQFLPRESIAALAPNQPRVQNAEPRRLFQNR